MVAKRAQGKKCTETRAWKRERTKWDQFSPHHRWSSQAEDSNAFQMRKQTLKVKNTVRNLMRGWRWLEMGSAYQPERFDGLLNTQFHQNSPFFVTMYPGNYTECVWWRKYGSAPCGVGGLCEILLGFRRKCSNTMDVLIDFSLANRTLDFISLETRAQQFMLRLKGVVLDNSWSK